jgi:hypothetical protein
MCACTPSIHTLASIVIREHQALVLHREYRYRESPQPVSLARSLPFWPGPSTTHLGSGLGALSRGPGTPSDTPTRHGPFFFLQIRQLKVRYLKQLYIAYILATPDPNLQLTIFRVARLISLDSCPIATLQSSLVTVSPFPGSLPAFAPRLLLISQGTY